ncbi:MAG: hypothetical protein Q4A87_08380 [Streptococcus sp.]|nr:hypothetical protein [Streptococcus sp.]
MISNNMQLERVNLLNEVLQNHKRKYHFHKLITVCHFNIEVLNGLIEITLKMTGLIFCTLYYNDGTAARLYLGCITNSELKNYTTSLLNSIEDYGIKNIVSLFLRLKNEERLEFLKGNIN